MRTLLLFIIFIIMIGGIGCSSRRDLAPVKDQNQPSSTKVGYHIVAQGETLYSIAWRYNLNYKALAKFNKINNIYTIHPGQKLILKEDFNPPAPAKNTLTPQVSSDRSDPKSGSQVVVSNHQNSLKKSSIPTKKDTVVVKSSPPSVWVWPSKGSITNGFHSKSGLSKGVDIAGKLGQPVVAASSGKVVYSGDGLRGYGKLIILKHSETFLSAYAHNRRLLVKEGEIVKQGQKIAEMGRSGTDLVKLHFEIRRDGKPVDPLRYLPNRKK